MDRLNALAWLISESVLDIRIAFAVDPFGVPARGLYHEKVGLFSDDEGNCIAFSGSANETVGGSADNFEAIDVYRYWHNGLREPCIFPLKACAYIRKRAKFMHYDRYKAAHIPLGGGTIEAACKTVFTQRLKLSGMRWSEEVILTLRTTLLSKHWDRNYQQYLDGLSSDQPRPYQSTDSIPAKLASSAHQRDYTL